MQFYICIHGKIKSVQKQSHAHKAFQPKNYIQSRTEAQALRQGWFALFVTRLFNQTKDSGFARLVYPNSETETEIT